MTNELTTLRNLLRALWTALGLGLVVWVILMNIPPGGSLRVSARPGEASGFIGILRPDDRVRLQKGEEPKYEALNDPLYFSLGVPPFFRRAKVRVEFKNDAQPIIEIGPRLNPDQWQFGLVPIDAPLLDDSGWASRNDGRYRIYERNRTSKTTEEILKSGDPRRTAVYHLDSARWEMNIPNARDTGASFESLKQQATSYKLYVYVAKPPFQMTVSVSGASDIKVVKDGETVLSRSTESGGGEVELGITGAKTGLYRIDADVADPETVIRSIKTRHGRLSVVGGQGTAGFEPEFPTLTTQTDLTGRSIDTIVTTYRPPAALAGDWKLGEAEFDLPAAAVRAGEIQVLLSIPAIRDLPAGRQGVDGTVLVRNIEVEYLREPLTPRSIYEIIKRKL